VFCFGYTCAAQLWLLPELLLEDVNQELSLPINIPDTLREQALKLQQILKERLQLLFIVL
jgi:hypothetical protein